MEPPGSADPGAPSSPPGIAAFPPSAAGGAHGARKKLENEDFLGLDPFPRESQEHRSGVWAVTGPKQVTVDQGSSLAVSCSYEPGYKLNSKYWCRQNSLRFCFAHIIQTSGSEVMVTQGRVSIRDNHTAHSFTVTLSGVTPGDAGQYSCGVKRKLWFSTSHTTRVMVSAAASTSTEGSNMGLLTSNTLGSSGCRKPPVLSQLSVAHLLLLLSLKFLVALALVCGAAWMRRRYRSCNQENQQLFEASSSTRTPGCQPSLPADLRAPGTPSCPLPPHPAGAVPPITAAPCHKVLGSR
ncbi:LOW QUALITY PROTEIN: protein CD300H-like [Myiozetetes cayanensis]|uniref:LOW QUALITY PROTEIN: protein CD300H-like n=1 Tax=Myiozetetes cayanensis TaxID=478635 RepID=UPI00215FAD20|nr:LOW QUALITY PROTEIN: protein CD300H-like [Myiozetetes cayanensis]